MAVEMLDFRLFHGDRAAISSSSAYLSSFDHGNIIRLLLSESRDIPTISELQRSLNSSSSSTSSSSSPSPSSSSSTIRAGHARFRRAPSARSSSTSPHHQASMEAQSDGSEPGLAARTAGVFPRDSTHLSNPSDSSPHLLEEAKIIKCSGDIRDTTNNGRDANISNQFESKDGNGIRNGGSQTAMKMCLGMSTSSEQHRNVIRDGSMGIRDAELSDMGMAKMKKKKLDVSSNPKLSGVEMGRSVVIDPTVMKRPLSRRPGLPPLPPKRKAMEDCPADSGMFRKSKSSKTCHCGRTGGCSSRKLGSRKTYPMLMSERSF